MRFGTVAIVGRSNVGKSTFLNAALGQGLAIVSPRPQTTRDALLGVLTRPEAQIAFVDTPGLHRPKTELGRRMNAAALDAVRTTDLVVFMTDVWVAGQPRVRPGELESAVLPAQDLRIIEQLSAGTPAIAVINKVDLLKNKSKLLPVLAALGQAHQFNAFLPVSMLNASDVERVLQEIINALPEGTSGYDPDSLTDRPVTFFVREYIREQVLQGFEREVPHAVAVSIESYQANKRVAVIQATIHVEKPGQRAILLGKGGTKLRDIGIGARARIEQLIDTKVHLELFVRVTSRWKDMPRQLAELGYQGGESLPQHFAEEDDDKEDAS
jgi:GTP-binding protein Era